MSLIPSRVKLKASHSCSRTFHLLSTIVVAKSRCAGGMPAEAPARLSQTGAEFSIILMRTRLAVIAIAIYPFVLGQGQRPANAKPHATARPKPVAASGDRFREQQAADQEEIRELTHRIQILELEIMQANAKTGSDKNIAIITAGIGAAAVFGAAVVAAILGIFGQLLGARRTAQLARTEALYRHAENVLKFQIKQVQEFYAPIFALLRQSKDLYDKMLEQLVEDDSERYRKVPTAVGSEFRWEVRDEKGEWKGFRLLDQFPAIKRNPKALALADANLEIGAKICKVISTRAGYASEDLVDMLGQYMAHYAILSAIRHGSETLPFEPGWHKVGYYPFGLDTRIRDTYREISKSIDEYGRLGMQTLGALANANREPTA